MNLGTPEKVIVLELAERVRVAAGAVVPIEFTQRPEDDPQLKGPLETGLEGRVARAFDAWTT